MTTTQEITVDVARKNAFNAIVAKQLDLNSRFLKIKLTDMGSKLFVNSNATALIDAQRPDNNAKSFKCVVNDDGTITAPLKHWMLELEGYVKCDIAIVDADNSKLTSTTFSLLVEKRVCECDTVTDDDGNDLIVTLINDVSVLKEDIENIKSNINNINTDVSDIRTAADGTTYETAGEAVRAQVNGLKAVDDELKNDISVLNDTVKNNALRKRYAYKIPYLLPDGYIGTYRPVNIFYDGVNFSTDYNKDNFKHKGGNTFFVKPSGNGSTDGSTREKATNLNTAYNKASDGDTIVFTEGLYVFYNGMGTAIQNFPYNFTKSINIIGEGDVKIICGGVGSFTLDSETGLYKFTLTNNSCGKIISRDLSYEYKRVTSIADCQTTNKSFYTNDGKNLYINDSANPSDNVYLLYTFELFKAHNTANQRIYLENLTIVGSGSCFDINEADGTMNEVIAESCNFMYCTNENANFRVRGGKTLLHSCKSIGARNDGFAYMGFNKDSKPVGAEFIEIDCIGAFNGIGASGNYHNGTTAHQHCHGIRINGSYYGNQGGNITDVQEDCQTVNLGCVAYDSNSTTDFYNQGISIQQAGAEMWCESCLSWGNKYDIYLYPDSSMHLNNCVFDIKATEGTFENTNQRDTEYFVRRKYFA